MALRLKTPAPARGALWVREGFRLFGRKPLAFSGMFAAFLFAALVVAFVPLVGGLLQMMLVPLLSLGFMVASSAALRGEPVQPGHYVEGFSGPPARRRALIGLCVTYGLAAVAVLVLADLVSGGKLQEMMALWARGDATREEIDALAADRGVFLGALTALLGSALVSVPFWHAPALVVWGGQGVGQALFSSTLAVWRAKGAFLVYGLSWAALGLVFGTVTAVMLSLLGTPQLAGVVAIPGALIFSTVFYVSLIFGFADSFGDSPVEDLPPA